MSRSRRNGTCAKSRPSVVRCSICRPANKFHWGPGSRPVVALEGTAAAAGRARNGLVHDALDGAGAPTALRAAAKTAVDLAGGARGHRRGDGATDVVVAEHVAGADRKSTRLNSSHLGISYAVF